MGRHPRRSLGRFELTVNVVGHLKGPGWACYFRFLRQGSLQHGRLLLNYFFLLQDGDLLVIHVVFQLQVVDPGSQGGRALKPGGRLVVNGGAGFWLDDGASWRVTAVLRVCHGPAVAVVTGVPGLLLAATVCAQEKKSHTKF